MTEQNALGGRVRLAMGAAMLIASWGAAAEPLNVKLDWTPWAVHAPFHLAMQKGWFKQAGLDVRLEDGNGSVTTVQIVGGSDRFDVGHAALASMVIARSKGLPVKGLAPFATSSDIGVLVPADSGITGPDGLKGRKIAYTAGSLEAPFVDAFLAAGGLRRSDVDLLSVDAAGKAATYAVGRADAVISTIPFVLPSVSRQRPSAAIPFARHGLDMVSFGLFASEQKLASREQDIRTFSNVVAKSWNYIYDGHEQEAVDAIVAQRPNARLDKAILLDQLNTLKTYFGPAVAGGSIGVSQPADWDKTIATLERVELIPAGQKAADYYQPGVVSSESLAGLELK
ncbi:MAG: ABC transporter substrate-binding protein [Alcaligenes sp.]